MTIFLLGVFRDLDASFKFKNSKYQKDTLPLDESCQLKGLNQYSKGYLNHLIKSNEMMASMLISLHNINFYQQFMSEIRKNIKNGTFVTFYKKYINHKPGVLSALFLIFYSVFRFKIEFTREPDAHLGLVFMELSQGQVMSILFFVVGLIVLKIKNV